MKYEFSSKFVNAAYYSRDFSEIWTGLCYEALAAELGQSGLVRYQSRDYGIDILHQPSGTAFLCVAVNNPAEETLSTDDTLASLALAEKHRESLKWNRLAFCTNAPYSMEAMDTIIQAYGEHRVEAGELGFLGPERWSALLEKHPAIVAERFDYRIRVSLDAVVKAFKDARYYERYVKDYEDKIKQDNYHVVLTNNRTAVELEIPFSPDMTVENLVDVGHHLLDVSLDSSIYRDLNTSARMSISAVANGSTLTFEKKLSEVPIHSGGYVELFLRIIWREEEPKPSDQFIPERPVEKLNLSMSYFHAISFDLFSGVKKLPSTQQPSSLSPGEETISRKERGLASAIWQRVTTMLGQSRPRAQSTGDQILSPVRLGASAPRSVAPGSSFLARFVAYHADLESLVAKQLQSIAPEAEHQLDYARANWALGTKVEVHAYGDDLKVDPPEDQFVWGGEKHILNFRVHVDPDANGPHDLKFDVIVDGLRISRVWMEIDISPLPSDERRTITVSTPRTAFASYSSMDRLRVLDRVSSLEIHCGMRIFLDCISMRPNAKWRELLPEMIRSSDQLLLFWSKSARDSDWVSREWHLAFETKGIDGVEVHPLETYDDAPLPKELAELVHGYDPKMVIRAYEKRIAEKKLNESLD